jgi:hypothetical protein
MKGLFLAHVLDRISPAYAAQYPGFDFGAAMTGVVSAAKRWKARAKVHGWDTRLLINSQATGDAQLASVREALHSYDQIMLFRGTHGGQRAGGNEPDRLREFNMAWDRPVFDTEWRPIWREMRMIQCLLAISDLCHSQGGLRQAAMQRGKQFLMRTVREAACAGVVVNAAGCEESGSSRGSNSGGLWSDALADGEGTPATWFGRLLRGFRYRPPIRHAWLAQAQQRVIRQTANYNPPQRPVIESWGAPAAVEAFLQRRVWRGLQAA